MYTIGTAGHVDHGKSALVRAMTGIDPDRLAEEKERGMTIDLGFAWLQLPSGREISIVDVPGHERFIKNMLAGVGGIDLALLVIAADEGVMPQTREHLAILDLLRVKRGMIVLTKKDLVEPDWLVLVRDDVREQLQGTVFADAPIVATSAVTRDGLPEMLATLDHLLEETPPRKDIGKPRLPVDRVFTISGFGTVVTGTLLDGQLQVGQELEVLPKGLKTRVRGLQTHKHKVEAAAPGNRVAVNVASLATTDLQRGDVITTPKWLRPTQALDVSLRVLRDAPRALRHGTVVGVFTGASETMARVSILDKEEIGRGEQGWAQLRTADPLVVVKGDYFIIRSSETTLGGGEVVEPHARRHRRFQTTLLRSLETLQQGTPEEVALQALDVPRFLELGDVAQRSGLPKEQAQAPLDALVARGQAQRLENYFVSTATWNKTVAQLVDIVRSYQQQYPLRQSMPREDVKSRLGLAARLFNLVVAELVRQGKVAEDNSALSLPDHRPQLSPEQERKLERLKRLLAENPYSPPSLPELDAQIGLEPELVSFLVRKGDLVRISDTIVYPPAVYSEMLERIKVLTAEKGNITVGEVRDIFSTSRKYALPLLEYLDEQKITRRVGDDRVLRVPIS